MPLIYALVVYPILMFIFFGLLISLPESLFVFGILCAKFWTLFSEFFVEIFFFRSFENYKLLEQNLYDDYFNRKISGPDAKKKLDFLQTQFQYFDQLSFCYDKDNRIQNIINQRILRQQNEQTFVSKIICLLTDDPSVYYKWMLTLKRDFPELTLEEFFLIIGPLEKDFFDGKLTRAELYAAFNNAINQLSVRDLFVILELDLLNIRNVETLMKDLATIAFSKNLKGDILKEIFIIYEPKEIEIFCRHLFSTIKFEKLKAYS